MYDANVVLSFRCLDMEATALERIMQIPANLGTVGRKIAREEIPVLFVPFDQKILDVESFSVRIPNEDGGPGTLDPQ